MLCPWPAGCRGGLVAGSKGGSQRRVARACTSAQGCTWLSYRGPGSEVPQEGGPAVCSGPRPARETPWSAPLWAARGPLRPARVTAERGLQWFTVRFSSLGTFPCLRGGFAWFPQTPGE